MRKRERMGRDGVRGGEGEKEREQGKEVRERERKRMEIERGLKEEKCQ